MKETQRCSICIMDTSDPEIVFYGKLGCNHCLSMKDLQNVGWFLDDSGKSLLEKKIKEIKFKGTNKNYDCILGLSGGLDSSYLALLAYDLGLRVLVVHVDGGWNSDLAVRNIQAILDYTNWDLHTEVIDWEEMRSLQLAYFKSGVTNQDVPQDHAFFASLYKCADKFGIKYVLSGGNNATEAIFPVIWHKAAAMDAINLKYINKKFGGGKLVKYPTISFFKFYIYYPLVKQISTIRLLNYVPYNVANAKSELVNRTGWTSYPRKHGESTFTRYFQDYYLVKRCGMDKRIPHLSSQIISKQISRESALELLSLETYSENELRKDSKFIAKKLDIDAEELNNFLQIPVVDPLEFPNWNKYRNILKKMQKILQKITGKKFTYFS